MGKDKSENQNKTSWFDGLKSEFRKITWPSKEQIGKETTAVVGVTVVAAILIAVIDTLVKYGIDFLVAL